MKKFMTKANTGWKFLGAFMTFVTLAYGSYQAYDHFRTPSITGEWFITIKNLESTKHDYVGDETVIKAYFTQKDKEVTGHGEKWRYRGKDLDYEQHRRYEFDGYVERDGVVINFVLHGQKRETTGNFYVEITDEGKKMKGTFTGTAADCKGTLTAVKIENIKS